MTRAWVCLVFAGILPGAIWAAEPKEKPVVSKTAPRLESKEADQPKGNAGGPSSAATTALPTLDTSRTFTAPVDAMNTNIEAASRDEVPIELEPPPMDLPFKDVVGFARPGQTERVLTGPVEHLPANEILGMAVLTPRQAFSPIGFRIPSPPFVRMEVPAGYESSNWSFTVEQGEQTVYQVGGMAPPRDLVTWDGFKDGAMALLAGVVYSPVLKLVNARGIPQQYFGDPLRFDALQYDLGNVRHVEFCNDVLFQRDAPDLAIDAAPLVRSLLNGMRENMGAPYRVTVFESEGGSPLAERRAALLSRFLQDALVLDPENLVVATSPPGPRGPVTEILITLPAAPEGGS